MKTKLNYSLYLIVCLMGLNSCAFVDKHLFDPAASHARVAPLFRTAECRNYNAPDGQHWFTTLFLDKNEHSTKNISSLVIQDKCDHQTKSIDDNPNSSSSDRLYFEQCENKEDNKNLLESQERYIKDKEEVDSKKIDIEKTKKIIKLFEDEANLAQKKANKNKTKTNIESAEESNNKVEYWKEELQQKQASLAILEEKAKNSQAWIENYKKNSIGCFSHLISKSDEICEIHKSHIYGNRTAMNTIFQVLATGAGIAGSMSGPGSAQALAGSAGFLTGSQAIMNEEVYKNTVTQAILLEINTNRQDFLSEKLKCYKDTPEKLTLGEIRRDAIEYHNKCSFYDGLNSLLNKAGKQGVQLTLENKALDRLLNQKKNIDSEIDDISKKIESAKSDPGFDKNKLKDMEQKLKTLESKQKSIDAAIIQINVANSSDTQNKKTGP